MHASVNSLTLFLSLVYQYRSAITSKVAAYTRRSFSPKCASKIILSFKSLHCSGIRILLLWYMVSSLHCRFVLATEILTWSRWVSLMWTFILAAASGTIYWYRAAINHDLTLLVLFSFACLVRGVSKHVANFIKMIYVELKSGLLYCLLTHLEYYMTGGIRSECQWCEYKQQVHVVGEFVSLLHFS